MESNETVLSDVHILVPFVKSEDSDCVCTRFNIKQLTPENDAKDDYLSNQDSTQLDEDGDYIVDRLTSNSCEVITIEHKLATVLQDVGLQVWRGSLLLADFILDNEFMFNECCAIELGAGAGLCSIVMSRVAKTVFCTDFRDDILENCQTNAEMNAHLCKNSKDKGSVVKVRKLDWTKGITVCEGNADKYSWSKNDMDELNLLSVAFAADVIYENHLTDALFKQVTSFLCNYPKAVFYLSIEKRLNFTLDDLDVACPAYNHFIQVTQTLASDNMLQAKQLPTIFTQHIDYQRVKELELWEIKAPT